MPKLDLFFFGPPRMEIDGVPVHIDTRKATALIAYLAVTWQPHSRDALAALLWPDADTAHARAAHARAALRRTLSPLNKALAGEWLAAERETIALKPDDALWSDVAVFRSHLDACQTHGHPATEPCPDCIASLSAAIQLYQDDFLSGFALRDSPMFDDWQFQQAENLRRDFGKALEQLVACYIGQADFKNAISYTQRWLALDDLYEPAHRTLMQLYAWTGQRTLALRQYRECVRVLDRELGVAPLHDTTQLYEAVRENATPPRQSCRATTSRCADHRSRATDRSASRPGDEAGQYPPGWPRRRASLPGSRLRRQRGHGTVRRPGRRDWHREDAPRGGFPRRREGQRRNRLLHPLL